MARVGMADPGATTRIPLTEGDWIDVKNEITYGEQEALGDGGLVMEKGRDGEPAVRVEMSRLHQARMCTWVVAWSFTDFKGNQLPVSPSTVASLRPDVASEVNAALDAYLDAKTKAAKAAKDAKGPNAPTPDGAHAIGQS